MHQALKSLQPESGSDANVGSLASRALGYALPRQHRLTIQQVLCFIQAMIVHRCDDRALLYALTRAFVQDDYARHKNNEYVLDFLRRNDIELDARIILYGAAAIMLTGGYPDEYVRAQLDIRHGRRCTEYLDLASTGLPIQQISAGDTGTSLRGREN